MTTYTRIAVVQIDYLPAIVADGISLLEDPGVTGALLPADSKTPEGVRDRMGELRGRIRATYTGQLLRKVEAILDACRVWQTRVVVFPEYSIPWEVLEVMAAIAPDMVVVAGTHMIEFTGRRSGVYDRLGVSAGELPRTGAAVAPVLHGGRIIALSAKFNPAVAVNERIEPGTRWDPVPLPDDIPGPMGVMVCLDFLYRENDGYRTLVAGRLNECRFITVPSLTRSHSVEEFTVGAWKEAKRYGRPVLYANTASGGGTSIFVDEGKRSALTPFPGHVGVLHPGEEGAIVADVNLGLVEVGSSTRFGGGPPVHPIAAATLVYRAEPGGEAYARWLDSLTHLLEHDDEAALDSLVARIAESRDLLRNTQGAASAPVRAERLAPLLGAALHNTTTVEQLRQRLREITLPPEVLPFPALMGAMSRGAAKAVVDWLRDFTELGGTATALRRAGGAGNVCWTPAALSAIQAVERAVHGVFDAPPPSSALPAHESVQDAATSSVDTPAVSVPGRSSSSRSGTSRTIVSVPSPYLTDVAIVTVIPPEYDAVLARLRDPRRDSGSLERPNQHAWQVGFIDRVEGGTYRVVLALAGKPGTTSAAMTTVETFSQWRPRYVLLVGIAGGLPLDGLQQGDVVASTVIWGYEYGKISAGFHPRNDFTYPADTSLLTSARTLSPRWKSDLRVSPPRPEHIPKALFGPVASGDKLIDEVTDSFFVRIRAAWPKLQAVEMEGAGAAEAMQRVNERTLQAGFLMIRGISDVPGLASADPQAARQTSERDAWTSYACAAAASFSAHLIAESWPIPPLDLSKTER